MPKEKDIPEEILEDLPRRIKEAEQGKHYTIKKAKKIVFGKS